MEERALIIGLLLVCILIVSLVALRRKGTFVQLVRLWGASWRIESRGTESDVERPDATPLPRAGSSEVIIGDGNQFRGDATTIVGGDLTEGGTSGKQRSDRPSRTSRVKIGRRNVFEQRTDIVGGSKTNPGNDNHWNENVR